MRSLSASDGSWLPFTFTPSPAALPFRALFSARSNRSESRSFETIGLSLSSLMVCGEGAGSSSRPRSMMSSSSSSSSSACASLSFGPSRASLSEVTSSRSSEMRFERVEEREVMDVRNEGEDGGGKAEEGRSAAAESEVRTVWRGGFNR